MRIAWIGAGPGEGGVSGVATQLITDLLRRGHEIDCYVAGDRSRLPLLPATEALRFFSAGEWWQWGRWYSRHQLGAFASGLLARATAQRELTRVLLDEHRAHPYDVLYQFSNIEMFGIQRHGDALPPIVLHPETHIAGELQWHRAERGLRRGFEPQWRSGAVSAVLRARSRRQRRDIHHANLVVCISESFQRHLVADYGIPSERTVVIPNPIDLGRFAFDPHPPGDPLTIVFVGRASVRKGIEHLVDLSHRLDDLAGAVRLRIVGGHTLWSDYRPLLDRVNRRIAEIVGPVPYTAIPELLCSADLLVQPSTYEPFGLTVGEALACGTPIVVTGAVGAGDFVQGPAVVKVPPSDAAALEHGVRTMLDRVTRMPFLRAHGRAEAERAFPVATVGARVEAGIEGLVERRQTGAASARDA